MSLVELFALDPDARKAALGRLSPSEAGAAWAVRSVLREDGHAEVRVAAAEWLGRARGSGAEGSLEDALYDSHESVRLAACRAVRRASVRAALPVLRRLALEEPVWPVRRAAVIAVASLEGAAAIPLLGEVLDDPFWRVRRAAAAALVTLGAKTDLRCIEPEAFSERAAAALNYVKRKLGLSAEEILGPDASPQPHGALADADPAVIAARLEHGLPATVAELVLYLGDSHEELRVQASRALARSNDLRALQAATLWLDEPRIPKAAATVLSLLADLDPRLADRLRESLLSDMDAHPFATMWALGPPASETSQDEWVSVLTRAAAARSPVIRRAAASGLGEAEALGLSSAEAREELGGLLSDDDDDVARLAAFALASSPDDASRQTLLEEVNPARVEVQPLLSRPVALAAAAEGEVDVLRALATSKDGATRAVATQALFDLGELTAAEIKAARASEDPDLRGATLDQEVALAFLGEDLHPPLRRAAFEVLVGTEQALAAARLASRSGDPWLRTRGAERLSRSDEPADIEIAFALLQDPDPVVRAAARDVTLRSEEVRRRLLQRAAEVAATPTASAETRPPQPVAEREAPATASPRALGRTGLQVSPLVVSGAHEPSVAALFAARRAGVNAFFWEPRYRALTTFLKESRLRGDRPLVVAGSYHASARGIRRDIDRACKALGRESIDVFLLFWARSAARLEGEGLRALVKARAEGRIKAFGFSTHDRALAGQALGASTEWDGVMVRHSAAHPGAEDSLFAAASARGAFVLTFSATSYGRLLGDGVTAAQCYRYSLSQEGVSACVSAPRGGSELMENLEVLASPSLESVTALRARGQAVRVESLDFARHIRRFPTQPHDLEHDVAEELGRLDDDAGEIAAEA